MKRPRSQAHTSGGASALGTAQQRADPVAQAARAEISRARRARGRISSIEFMRVYLPDYAQLPFSPMHIEVSDLVVSGSDERGMRLAIAAPRGHAKSTQVTLATVLRAVMYGLESFILIVCDTQDQAIGHLASIREQIENNPRLREDFPEACTVPPESRKKQVWRRSEIVTGNGVRISALGSGTKIRGRRHNESRPGLIICDDIENESMVRSPEQREQLAQWFNGALLKSGTATTNIIVIGTILHHDSLLATLTNTARSPGWRSRIYRAIEQWATNEPMWERWRSIYNGTAESGPTGRDAAAAFFASNRAEMLEGTRVLWPERDSYEQLMVMRLVDGQASFDAEKQNHPIDPERALFREREIMYWDDHHIGEAELIASLQGPIEIHAACDPSLGRAGRHNDDTAIIVLLRHVQSGVMYVLEADIARRAPDQIIDWLINLGKRQRLTRLAVESNQYQHFLASEISRRSAIAGVYLPVHKVTHTTDKLGRIQSLQPLVVNGTLRFCRRHTRLIEQLVQFPMAAHDDGPDALELAVESTRVSGVWVADPDATPPVIDAEEMRRREQRSRQEMLDELDHPAWREWGRG